SSTFRTYGRFALESNDPCPYDRVDDGCNPDGWHAIRFTNPVRLRDARRAVTLSPVVPMPDLGEDDTFETFSLGRGLHAKTTYRVTIAADLRDTFGQRYQG